ncbi:MAG TPA: hypothetical protein VFL66_00845 [Gaiellaceae bacterium]|nr:hypothetical protein [Gaiellaceae bacterium]
MSRPELFDLVALGGTALTRARFRVTLLGPRFELPPRSLILVTHRSDWDIPLTCNASRRGRFAAKPVFVARDDLFLPGFLAGYPPLPLPLRRALAGLDVGRVLRGQRLALPVASASRAQLVQVARELPSLPLDALPGDAVAAIRERARRLGGTEPRLLGDLLDGRYLDLLWRGWRRRDSLPGLDEFWARRQTVARRDFQALLDHVAGGGSLVVYPEGHPSPDGAIGPLERGLGVLVRRARPDALIPFGLAYDPLCRGRTRAYLAVGDPVPPAPRETERTVLAALRRTMPLTAGQVAAHALLHGRDARSVAAEALAEESRPREPRLAELLDEALAAAGVAPRHLLERLDLEFRSARAPA